MSQTKNVSCASNGSYVSAAVIYQCEGSLCEASYRKILCLFLFESSIDIVIILVCNFFLVRACVRATVYMGSTK